MLIFTAPAAPTDVPGPVPADASNFWTRNTSSIWHLKTQTAKIISQKSSLSTGLGNQVPQYPELLYNCACYSHDVLPIAMGARLEDYELAAPHKSFLHVDQFTGPRQLAKFLHKLDRDESLYNEYFQVRDMLKVQSQMGANTKWR